MKKSVIIPVLFSLLILAANLYAQTSVKQTDQKRDSILLSSKKMTLPKGVVNRAQSNEPEKIMEYTLEDLEAESAYKVIVYDIEGNEVFTLSSESKIDIDKLPKNAKLLMAEGKTNYYIVDKETKE